MKEVKQITICKAKDLLKEINKKYRRDKNEFSVFRYNTL